MFSFKGFFYSSILYSLKIEVIRRQQKKRRGSLTDIYARITKTEGNASSQLTGSLTMPASNSALNMAIFADPIPMAKESKVYMTAYTRLFYTAAYS